MIFFKQFNEIPTTVFEILMFNLYSNFKVSNILTIITVLTTKYGELIDRLTFNFNFFFLFIINSKINKNNKNNMIF